MDPTKEFEQQRKNSIESLGNDKDLIAESRAWMVRTHKHRYTYNFSWLGRPIIQFPQDMIALQELIWEVKPDVIVETGVAHGGSAIFFASMLQLCGGDGQVIAVDIEIRPHNRQAIEKHPFGSRIRLIEGSSIADNVLKQVEELVRGKERVLVVLDSDHTHDHVLAELRAYSKWVRKGSYVVVFDTSVEDAPAELFANSRFGKGNNPKTAVREFLRENSRFVVASDVEDKLLITVAPEGYLRCTKDP